MYDNRKSFTCVTPITHKEKALVILMLLCLVAVLIIPVNQAAQNRELSLELDRLNRSMVGLEESQRILQSQLAQAQMPEQTLAAASWQELSLRKLVYGEAQIVHVGAME